MRHRLEYLVVRALIAIVRVTPDALVRACGTLLGLAFYTARRRAPPDRRAQPRGRVSVAAARASAARSRARAFAHFGRLLFELLKFSTLSPRADAGARRVRRRGARRARPTRSGKGVLFVTGHFGFWELQAMVHALRVEPIGGAGARARQPAAERAARARSGSAPATRVIYRQGTIRRVMRTLQAGTASRVLIDQHIHEPRRDLRRFLRAAGGDDVGGRGAGAAHRRAGRAGVRAAARRRPLPDDLRAPGRAAARRRAGCRSASSRSAAPTCSRCTCAAIRSCGCGCTAAGATTSRRRTRAACSRRERESRLRCSTNSETPIDAESRSGTRQARARAAIGIRQPVPNARSVTFSPGAACLRLNSARAHQPQHAARRSSASKPAATISSAGWCRSMWRCRMSSRTSYGGSESWSVWFGRSSADGALVSDRLGNHGRPRVSFSQRATR